MLKKAGSFVLGSSKSSTYPWGYASGFDSPAALLSVFLSILYMVFSVSAACSVAHYVVNMKRVRLGEVIAMHAVVREGPLRALIWPRPFGTLSQS